MYPSEIVLPITQPETEWVRGRALQKMSPQRNHARVQLAFGSVLSDWARGRGEVGTEWRFRIAIPGEARRPLVPDIAFVAIERLRGLTEAELQVPTFAPTVAVEVLSPGDDPRDVAHKVDTYLRGGSGLVIVIDPATRSLRLHDDVQPQELGAEETLRHARLPEFELALGPFFARALDLPT